jgi:hypothetical protein
MRPVGPGRLILGLYFMAIACTSQTASPQSSPATRATSSSSAATATQASYSLPPGVKAAPEFVGPGAAGVCTTEKEPVVTVVLEGDVPNPRCTVIHGSQQLRVENHVTQTVHATLGPLAMVLPPGSSLTIKEKFDTFLRPGGHTMKADIYASSGTEFRLEAGT